MKTIIFIFTLLASALAMAQVSSWPLDATLRAELQKEIDFVSTLYASAYAPKSWKETHNGWNLVAETTLAQAKLAAAQNMFEAREAVGSLIKSTRDYHVSFAFYSTEKATLPFQVKTVEGKTLIISVDRTKLSQTAFPFSEGDEILTMDQVPTGQIFGELVKALGANIAETDQALADMYLTRRSGRANMIVPHGPVTFSIKRADGTVGSVQLAWEYAPEKLSQSGKVFSLNRPHNSLFSKKMLSGVAQLAMADAGNDNPYGLGVRRSFLPDMGARVWQTSADNTFDAYSYHNEAGQLIGVVRIPQYMADDYKKAVKDFSDIVSYMEKNTSALVIDQNNNPGGSVFYLYSLVSMLSDQVMTVPRHKIALTTSEAKDCVDALEKLKNVKNEDDAAEALGDTEGFPATFQLAMGTIDYCNQVLSQYHAGQALSSPLFLWGVDKINPNPVHYTKPIALLVNPLDFSGGDFFPAIMQDNKRATIVGVRTAGAGGFINEAQFPNNFGFETISFTGSIAERVSLNPIENLGVTPDVALPMTAEDYRDGFKAYEDGVRTALKDLLKN